jgi:hypothetical protein
MCSAYELPTSVGEEGRGDDDPERPYGIGTRDMAILGFSQRQLVEPDKLSKNLAAMWNR